MGMTATCAGCGREQASDNRRGGRLGTCPECGGQMRAHTAGKARGRYRCPVSGWVFTLGMRYSVRLGQPMRLVFVPGWDTTDREPDPDRPGWLRPVRRHRAEPDRQELEYLERAGHLVLGPGCAVERPFAQPGPDDYFHGHAGVYLLPAPDADPATWFVNEPLTYKKCAACPKKVVASGAARMPGEWKPRRDAYWKHGRNQPVSPGPHPAGSYACPDCDPRAGAA
jgi:predicted RNA-binding Zn-ribbon protein involved in translation (DUF1610 family)